MHPYDVIKGIKVSHLQNQGAGEINTSLLMCKKNSSQLNCVCSLESV